MARLLVIDDDPQVLELLKLHAGEWGHHLESAESGESGITKAANSDYALVILDLSLPGVDGVEVCRTLRAAKPELPIIMLTSKSEDTDRIVGLESGADDYLTKPFSVRELFARANALLRRMQAAKASVSVSPPVRNFEDLEIDFGARKVRYEGREIELTAIEFDLLAFLAGQAGSVFSRQSLMEEVWGYQASSFEPTVTMHLSRLRAKIEPDPAKPRYIHTVRGQGYRFGP